MLVMINTIRRNITVTGSHTAQTRCDESAAAPPSPESAEQTARLSGRRLGVVVGRAGADSWTAARPGYVMVDPLAVSPMTRCEQDARAGRADGRRASEWARLVNHLFCWDACSALVVGPAGGRHIMSDQSGGEGWWEASDGKWYPSDAHPSNTSTTAETPTSGGMMRKGWRRFRWLPWWVQVIAAFVVLGLLAAPFSSDDSDDTTASLSSSSSDTSTPSDPLEKLPRATTTERITVTTTTEPPTTTVPPTTVAVVAAPAPTAPPTTAASVERYANCTEMRKVHPNGVQRDHPAYEPKHDRDKDGHACDP